MIKNTFKKEIAISGPQSAGNPRNNKKEVIKIQNWLNLHARSHPYAGTATGVDGDYGNLTAKAVKNFQASKGMQPTGIVDENVFRELCAPLRQAFQGPLLGSDFRQLVIQAARLHLKNGAFELKINGQTNMGPWVRSYMDGYEGNQWFWCMGFVQTVIDQAASHLGKNFRTLMPATYSCDVVGNTGLQKRLLTRYSQLRQNPSLARPGDIFLVQKSPQDWIHTGIITEVHDGVFETIEGNTNTDGSSNGDGVYLRTRNFRTSKIDVFSVTPLC